jgi:hypothetical protein
MRQVEMRIMRGKILKPLIMFVALALATFVTEADASTTFWIGSTSGNTSWQTAKNWDGGTPSFDNVYIGTFKTGHSFTAVGAWPILDESATVDSLYISGHSQPPGPPSLTLSGSFILTVETNEEIGTSAGSGILKQSAGTNKIKGTLTIGYNSTSTGTYRLSGGILDAGSVNIKSGSLTQSGSGILDAGGSTGTAPGIYIGGGANTVKGGALRGTSLAITGGSLTQSGRGVLDVGSSSTASGINIGGGGNSSSVSVTGGSLIGTALRIDAGSGLTNDSTVTLSGGVNINSGYLAGSGQFNVGGNFTITTPERSDWNTSEATLNFVTGTGINPTRHTFSVYGTDEGATVNGYAPANFSWGTLNVSGQSLVLVDPNKTKGVVALYVDIIQGLVIHGDTIGNISDIGKTGFVENVYYNPDDNPILYKGGINGTGIYYLTNGGRLMPADPPATATPIPSAGYLLGSGILGLIYIKRRQMMRDIN